MGKINWILQQHYKTFSFLRYRKNRTVSTGSPPQETAIGSYSSKSAKLTTTTMKKATLSIVLKPYTTRVKAIKGKGSAETFKDWLYKLWQTRVLLGIWSSSHNQFSQTPFHHLRCFIISLRITSPWQCPHTEPMCTANTDRNKGQILFWQFPTDIQNKGNNYKFQILHNPDAQGSYWGLIECQYVPFDTLVIRCPVSNMHFVVPQPWICQVPLLNSGVITPSESEIWHLTGSTINQS